jgi:asparagine synthase (glutamine-hydrolysing)
MPDVLRNLIASGLRESTLVSASARRRLLHSFLGRDEDLESLYLDNFYAALDSTSRRRLLPKLNGGHEATCEHFMQCWNAQPGASLLSRMLYADQKTYLAELLMKQDRMSMAASIESRVPFLDHPLVEFASGLPDALKLRGRTGKYILKKAAEKLLPHEIIYRKKMGFPTPLRQWLRSKKCRPLLSNLRSRDSFLAAYLDRAALDGLLKRHESGQEECTDAVWRLLNLHQWGEIFITGRREVALDGAQVRKAVAAG